jgi:hypothetical protein
MARAALALAEALIPGSSALSAADEATVRRAEELVASMHPALLRAWRIAQTTLDTAAYARRGQPFHALSVRDQDALLRRWERDPVLSKPLALISFVYKVVHFDEPLRASLRVVRSLDEPRWLHQVHRGDQWEGGDIDCDVGVVG